MIRILLISYYFPPCNAIGSKRWGEMYEILSKYDEIETTVITANWERDNDIPGVNYIGEPIKYTPPNSILKKNYLLSRIKHPSEYFRSLAYETIFGNWRRQVISWIDKRSSYNFDITIASFAPVSAILVGNHAKKTFNSKLIIDLRDLLSLQGQKLRIPVIHWLDKMVDKYICRHADMITTIGPTTEKKAKEFYNVPVHTIYNGFKKNQKIRCFSPELKNIINIGYFGTIGYNRSPVKILKLLSAYLFKNSDKKIILHIASNDNFLVYLKDIQLNNRLKIKSYGYLRGNSLRDLYETCDIYLILEDQTDKGIENLTGKIFDYMYKGKPIIASCNINSDIGKILSVSGTGDIISTNDDLLNFFCKYKKGSFYSDPKKTNLFSREVQVDNLISYLVSLVEVN